MRLQIPQLPAGKDAFSSTLVFKLKQLLTSMTEQVNGVTEGRVSATTNADSGAPTGGTYFQGDWIRNKAPVELGSPGSQYVVLGWVCVASGQPGQWREARVLTGN